MDNSPDFGIAGSSPAMLDNYYIHMKLIYVANCGKFYIETYLGTYPVILPLDLLTYLTLGPTQLPDLGYLM